MIIGELARRKLAPTILTAMTILRVNVTSRELHLMVVSLHLHIAKQTQDRRQGNGEGDTSDLAVVFCQYLNLLLEEHTQSALPRNHVQGLIRRIQDQYLFHICRICREKYLLHRKFCCQHFRFNQMLSGIMPVLGAQAVLRCHSLVPRPRNTLTFTDGSCEGRSRSEEEVMQGHRR